MPISRDDWLNALRATEPVCDPDALTVQELTALYGLKASAMKVRIRKLVTDGVVRPTHKKVTDVSGRVQTVPAFRLVTVGNQTRPSCAKRANRKPLTART